MPQAAGCARLPFRQPRVRGDFRKHAGDVAQAHRAASRDKRGRDDGLVLDRIEGAGRVDEAAANLRSWKLLNSRCLQSSISADQDEIEAQGDRGRAVSSSLAKACTPHRMASAQAALARGEQPELARTQSSAHLEEAAGMGQNLELQAVQAVPGLR